MKDTVVAAGQGGAEPVGVIVQLLERHALRADEALAEDIRAVAADRSHTFVLTERDLETTGGLAQRTGAKDGGHDLREPYRHHPRTLPTAVSKASREVIADWLIVIAAVVLFVSLFLPWSHQFSSAFLVQFGDSPLLNGVPHDPTAWQLYSVVDVLLALLAGGLFVAALIGNRSARAIAAIGVVMALGFTIHAVGHPPTNGATLFDPALSVPGYVSSGARSGSGELVAIVALGVAIVGLALSFTAD